MLWPDNSFCSVAFKKKNMWWHHRGHHRFKCSQYSLITGSNYSKCPKCWFQWNAWSHFIKTASLFIPLQIALHLAYWSLNVFFIIINHLQIKVLFFFYLACCFLLIKHYKINFWLWNNAVFFAVTRWHFLNTQLCLWISWMHCPHGNNTLTLLSVRSVREC